MQALEWVLIPDNTYAGNAVLLCLSARNQSSDKGCEIQYHKCLHKGFLKTNGYRHLDHQRSTDANICPTWCHSVNTSFIKRAHHNETNISQHQGPKNRDVSQSSLLEFHRLTEGQRFVCQLKADKNEGVMSKAQDYMLVRGDRGSHRGSPNDTTLLRVVSSFSWCLCV